jgi:hypothetical protein
VTLFVLVLKSRHLLPFGRIARVVERRPLDHEVRGSNPSHDIIALLLGRHYEFPQCGIIKENNEIISIKKCF